MPRWDKTRAVVCGAWLVALLLGGGCAHSEIALREQLANRVMPVEGGSGESSIQHENRTVEHSKKDAAVRPTVVPQASQGSRTQPETERASSLPAAIIPPPRRVNSDQMPPTTVALPGDSDEAAFDAMTAAGKPLPLDDAIQHAFRLQPRLRAQLENIAQARGQQQIAFSAFLPLVAANYDTGMFSLGANGNSIGLPKNSQGFNFIPGVRAHGQRA